MSIHCDVSPTEIKQANIPHELFLTNLVGNHILMAVALGGIFGSAPWAMLIVPLVSFAILGYTLRRARQSRRRDSWYVMCHWQVCARRSRIFMAMLGLLLVVAGLGWLGYANGLDDQGSRHRAGDRHRHPADDGHAPGTGHDRVRRALSRQSGETSGLGCRAVSTPGRAALMRFGFKRALR
ncbi:MAG: hypothetical protein MZV65_10000 [Chromatiales bacterium]|nr:hypothetical protein [Chromatiales bacterium]